MINVTQVSKLKLCKLYCSKGSPSPWSSCGKFLFSRYVQCTTNFHSLCKTDANNQKVFIVNTWKERRCNNYVPLRFFEQLSKLQVFHQYSACLQTYDSSPLPEVGGEVVAGADVVGHVDGGRHEVVCVWGVLVVVIQAPGEAEALTLNMGTPAQGQQLSNSDWKCLVQLCTQGSLKIKFCMPRSGQSKSGHIQRRVGEY